MNQGRRMDVLTKRVFAVLGAGAGGQAMAGALALEGYRVRLWNRTAGRLMPIWRRERISLEGAIHGDARLELITTNLAEAVQGADVVMVVTPATAHRDLAHALGRVLSPSQIVVLNPGRTGGALEFAEVLAGYMPRLPSIAEAQTLLFATRSFGKGVCHIYSVKRFVALAALPADQTAAVLAALNPALPQFYAAKNVLETSLDNMGAIFHPGVTLLNSAHIEATAGAFEYYLEGITPTVAKVIGLIDSERMEIADAYGVRSRSARHWLAEAYGAEGETLYEAVRNNEGYAGIKAPAHLNHRYISEDIPTSLVPLSELGRIAGVATPTMIAMIDLASAVHGTDYRREGRNAARMGIAGYSPAEVIDLASQGGLELAETYEAPGPASGDLPG